MNIYLADRSAKEREKRQPQRTERENATNSFTISGKDAGIGITGTGVFLNNFPIICIH